jgi:hypothetical protein
MEAQPKHKGAQKSENQLKMVPFGLPREGLEAKTGEILKNA